MIIDPLRHGKRAPWRLARWRLLKGTLALDFAAPGAYSDRFDTPFRNDFGRGQRACGV
jgi:hypothetical protein